MKIKNYISSIANPKSEFKIEAPLFYSLILFLPTQLGKHFWPDFAYVHGLRIDYLSPTVYFTDVLILLIFILWFYRALENRVRQRVKSKDKKLKINIRNQIYVNCFVGIFALLFLLFNITISSSRLNGMYYLWKLAEMSFIAYYTAKFITDKVKLSKAIFALGASSILESLLAIFQFLKHSSIGGPLYFFGERTFSSSTPGIANASINGELILRPYGTFSHPNVLAGFLVVVMILVLFSLNRHCEEQSDRTNCQNRMGLSRSMQSPARTFCLILGSIALFLTLSRVAILLWILIVGYFLVKFSFRAKSRNLVYFNFLGKRSLHSLHLVGMTVVLLFFSLLLTPLGSRFTSLNLADEAVVQREALSAAAVKMIESSPLVGIGLGNFISTLARQQKPLTVATKLQPVHNIFLLVAAEAGLIGLGFFVWFLWKTFREVRSHLPAMQSKALQAGKSEVRSQLLIVLSSILVLGMFDHYWLTLQQGQLLFAVIIGLSFSSLNIISHKFS